MSKLKQRTLWGAHRTHTCYYLIDYHKYWLDKAARVKNPHFSPECGLILSFKDAQHRDHKRAVSHFAKQITAALKGLPSNVDFNIYLVPSSKVGYGSAGLDAVARYLCREYDNLHYVQNALYRHRTIAKLAHGGDRSVGVHIESITYRPPAKGIRPIILLDDVCTTGNSLVACLNLITFQHAVADLKVTPVVLGSTVDE